MFWNCVTDEVQKYQMPFSPHYFSYLSSTPNQIPYIVASDNQKLFYKVNHTSKTVLISDLDIARQSGLYQFVTPLSSKKFIIGRGKFFERNFFREFWQNIILGIFDIELGQIVTKFPKDEIYIAKKPIIGDNIIGATRDNIVIYDKDLREVSRSDPYAGTASYGVWLHVLDENLVSYYSNAYPRIDGAIIDIRTMKALHTDLKFGVSTKWNRNVF